jgi:hypothetical protein
MSEVGIGVEEASGNQPLPKSQTDFNAKEKVVEV